METFNLQEFITERNIELQEFIKELMIDTPAISTTQMIDAYYSTIQRVTARLIELEGKNEAWNKHRDIIMKKVAKKEKKARKQERYSRKLIQEYNRKYNANIH